MVRKDFILQNFVGTGGLVDARAVRCHERIARWHCLCEHQLSHISEYVLNQSQQNVQELGQTMKTLNQFYDDSMGRALREVPDETGRETRTNVGGLTHGCGAESVQGQSPIDYDGTAMVNDTNHVTDRLIGAHAVSSLHHGTAEPEMRGLYILLTIDNDGGLEVNKYASRLYEERPEVYHTKPVQLALSVYKVCTLCF
jgi:SAC3/GANP family